MALLLGSPAAGVETVAPRAWTWGAALGSPQILAVTLERRADARVRVQAHAGTILLLSSAGIRAVMISTRQGLAPYAFLGLGILHTSEGEGGGPIGSTGFGWGGLGARLHRHRVSWFAELGALGGMDTESGYERWGPGLAVGIAFGGER